MIRENIIRIGILGNPYDVLKVLYGPKKEPSSSLKMSPRVCE